MRRDAQIKAQQVEIRAIEVALESFYSDFLQYPPDPNDIDSTATDSHDATLDSFIVDNPDDPEQNDPNIVDTLGNTDIDNDGDIDILDNASEVFYYYLCRRWEKTGGTVVCQIALDIDGDGNIDPKEYPGPGVDTDGDGSINEDNIDVPGGNGSPYLAPKKDRIGDSDGDGLLELLDIWGKPYLYWNNADGVTCLTTNDPQDTAPIYAAFTDTLPPGYPANAVKEEVDRDGDADTDYVWHFPHNEFTFDIYSLGLNRADNLGFDNINFGNAKTDDDIDGTEDFEDDVNNY